MMFSRYAGLVLILMASSAHAAIFPDGDDWIKEAMTGDPYPVHGCL